ncbi:hypothetical protein [Phytopseudomonas dryadis]|uniref:Uncharacterized protein n=1 Tax=Phytopseudomonas dryadis TaxID=2487520 RepID=A0A4Q9QZW0_9GAMM|nr:MULTISPECIES: hypothetical protein [Pseudomonas]TBU91577.1 hypothetical protein DNK44_13975 [Pseudomonas dryadis]TBV07631.1 hypothetical protein DNK34_07950 [Pseudomonas dryadis]TBV19942.1 hypothetical protein DNK41_00400 [Pseudomonas sp. FRB 230]
MSGATALRQLDQLRRLRERRAELQLGNWQQRCREAGERVARARAEAGAALDLLEGEARQLQALLAAGALPVGRYRAALDLLDALEAQRARLACHADAVAAELSGLQLQRDQAQQHWYLRQRQCEALQPMLQRAVRVQQRAAEAVEESLGEDRPRMPGGQQP